MTITHKFEVRYQIDWTTGCWEWTGGKSDGYGEFYIGKGKHIKAHRWIYGQKYGQTSQVLHHVCENRSCVNPDHLEEMSIENHLALHKEQRTHYRCGHEITPENTYHYPPHARECKSCKDQKNKEWARYNREYISSYHKERYKRLKDAKD